MSEWKRYGDEKPRRFKLYWVKRGRWKTPALAIACKDADSFGNFLWWRRVDELAFSYAYMDDLWCEADVAPPPPLPEK